MVKLLMSAFTIPYSCQGEVTYFERTVDFSCRYYPAIQVQIQIVNTLFVITDNPIFFSYFIENFGGSAGFIPEISDS